MNLSNEHLIEKLKETNIEYEQWSTNIHNDINLSDSIDNHSISSIRDIDTMRSIIKNNTTLLNLLEEKETILNSIRKLNNNYRDELNAAYINGNNAYQSKIYDLKNKISNN